jgi:tetratricopeptide (TPR) repeat protein
MNSATLSVEELVSLGKTNYGKKRYEVALDCFRAALFRSQPPSMDVLDYLAAVCDKMERTEESLQYGKQMIQLDDANARVGPALRIREEKIVIKLCRDIFELDVRLEMRTNHPTHPSKWRFMKEASKKCLHQIQTSRSVFLIWYSSTKLIDTVS